MAIVHFGHSNSVLGVLREHKHELVTREQMAEAMGRPVHMVPFTRLYDMAVSKARTLIEPSEVIVTVRGQGYMLTDLDRLPEDTRIRLRPEKDADQKPSRMAEKAKRVAAKRKEGEAKEK